MTSVGAPPPAPARPSPSASRSSTGSGGRSPRSPAPSCWRRRASSRPRSSASWRPLADVRDRTVFTVYGGVGYEPQRRAMRRGVDILVACPGRLEDLIAQRVVDLSMVDIVVIDEADRMADMGFLPAVRRILDATAKERQTILFSATLDGDVGVITRSYQRDAVRHEVPGQESDAMDAEHRFETVHTSDRLVPCRRGHPRRGADDRVLPHAPRRRQDREEARRGRRPGGADPRWALAGPARPCARRVHPRLGARARRDRRRGTRHPRRRRGLRPALRPADRREDLRPPLRSHRPQGRVRCGRVVRGRTTRCGPAARCSASSASATRARSPAPRRRPNRNGNNTTVRAPAPPAHPVPAFAVPHPLTLSSLPAGT